MIKLHFTSTSITAWVMELISIQQYSVTVTMQNNMTLEYVFSTRKVF